MYQDTKLADGFYIQWAMILEPDPSGDRPDERDDGFWLSEDPADAGYVLPENYAAERAKAIKRMAAWERGYWQYVGVIAEARCLVVAHGVGTHITLRSPGLWGVEDDAGDYLQEVYAEQKAELLGTIELMRNPIQSEAA